METLGMIHFLIAAFVVGFLLNIALFVFTYTLDSLIKSPPTDWTPEYRERSKSLNKNLKAVWTILFWMTVLIFIILMGIWAYSW